MNNAPADPLSWYYDIPVVTRVYLTAAFVTTVSNSLLSADCSRSRARCCLRHPLQISTDALDEPIVVV